MVCAKLVNNTFLYLIKSVLKLARVFNSGWVNQNQKCTVSYKYPQKMTEVEWGLCRWIKVEYVSDGLLLLIKV